MTKKQKLKKIYNRIKNVFRRSKDFFIIKKNNWNYILKQNKKFHNMHKGERCFILGNGPSLNKEDLSLITNEIVFTVNQVSRRKDINVIKPNYHFWADQAFFDLDLNKKEDIELLNTMSNIKVDGCNTVCFYPINQQDFVKKNNLDKNIESHYFYTNQLMYEGFDEYIDFTKAIPGGGTVIMWCIQMAIYMGFKEIYLLGCDNTGLINNINAIVKSDSSSYLYSYDVTENEKKRYEGLSKKYSLESGVVAYLNTFIGYRLFNQYCVKRNIRFINCSCNTAIDCIPRMRLEDVFK